MYAPVSAYIFVSKDIYTYTRLLEEERVEAHALHRAEEERAQSAAARRSEISC